MMRSPSLKEAQAAKGEKSPYDSVCHQYDARHRYVKKNDYMDAAPLLEAAARSEYCPPAQAKAWLRAVMVIYYSNKDYTKTVELGEQVIKRGAADDETTSMMGDSYYHLGKFKEAGDSIQQVTDKQDKPEEKFLKFEYSCFTKANDSKAAEKVLDKLVTYYPKPDYWANRADVAARMRTSRMRTCSWRVPPDVRRRCAQAPCGSMRTWRRSRSIKAIRARPLRCCSAPSAECVHRSSATRSATSTCSTAPSSAPATIRRACQQPSRRQQKAPDGDMLVQLGAAYLSYGQAARRSPILQQGIAKGMLKYPDEANLLLGMRSCKRQAGRCRQGIFEKVASSQCGNYARLGKLWTLLRPHRLRIAPPEPNAHAHQGPARPALFVRIARSPAARSSPP